MKRLLKWVGGVTLLILIVAAGFAAFEVRAFNASMEARHRAGDVQAARRDAQRYLQRFPSGPYAATASGILAE